MVILSLSLYRQNYNCVPRSSVPGESYVKGWHLLPWNGPVPLSVLPLPFTAFILGPTVLTLLPHCVQSSIHSSGVHSRRYTPHMTHLRFALVVTHTACGPHCSRNCNHILSSEDLLDFKIYYSKRSTLPKRSTFLPKDLLRVDDYSSL